MIKNLSTIFEAVSSGPFYNFEDQVKIVEAAKEYNFACIFTQGCFYPYVLKSLKGYKTAVGGGIGSYSCGIETTEQKLFLTHLYQNMGCQEIDCVLNISYIRSGMADRSLVELEKIRSICQVPLKVIIEAPMLSEKDLKIACEVVLKSGADYIKTGTGHYGPTTINIVQKIKDIVGDKIMIKAAGGINDIDTIEKMLNLGVNRIGLNYTKAIRFAEQN